MNKQLFFGLSMFSLLSFTNVQANPQLTWKIDLSGSKVAFITQGKGGIEAYFSKFHGHATLDPQQPTSLKIQFEIDANSLNAGLKNPFYKGKRGLNVNKYPKLHFHSTHMSLLPNQQYQLHGILNMHGVNQPVTWKVKIQPDTTSAKFIKIHAVTWIDRRQWGMNDFENMIQPTIQLDVQAKLIPNK